MRDELCLRVSIKVVPKMLLARRITLAVRQQLNLKIVFQEKLGLTGEVVEPIK